MNAQDDPKVFIRREWNDFRIGAVRLSQLSGLDWDTVSGGVGRTAPHPFIHGYTWCTDVEGEIAHSCSHGPAPHWIKVCVVKKDNEPAVFKRLVELAGPKPKKEPKKGGDKGGRLSRDRSFALRMRFWLRQGKGGWTPGKSVRTAPATRRSTKIERSEAQMEKITIEIGRTRNNDFGEVGEDFTHALEFEGEVLGAWGEYDFDEAQMRETEKSGRTQTLYRTSDGRLIVYEAHWSELPEAVSSYEVVEVSEAALATTRDYADLARKTGFRPPLTLDEALGKR